MREIPYPTPGQILQFDFLRTMHLSAPDLAASIEVPVEEILGILSGELPFSDETGLRLARFFGTSEDFWTGLQADFDAATASSQPVNS